MSDTIFRGIVVPVCDGRHGHPLLFSSRYRDEVLTARQPPFPANSETLNTAGVFHSKAALHSLRNRNMTDLTAALVYLVATTAAGDAPDTCSPASREAVYRGPLLAMTGDDMRPVNVWNPAGKPVLDPYFALDRKGLALVGRDSSLRLEGGCFFSGGAEEYLGGGLRHGGGELSLAAYVNPTAQKGAGLIIGYGPPDGDLLFALKQEKDALTFTIAAAPASKVTLAKLKSADPFHLLLTVGQKAIVCYRNGKRIARHPGIKGDFSRWKDGRLYFGNDRTGSQPWHGRIERAALYNKALTPDAAAKAAKAVLTDIQDREPVPRIAFTGTLLARSQYPMPWKEGFTYRDVLAVCEYKVEQVVRGEYEADRIRVAQWVYVDRIFLTNARTPVGTQQTLVVERLDINPQLSTIERADTLDLDMDLMVYYDLSPLRPLPKDQWPRPEKEKRTPATRGKESQ